MPYLVCKKCCQIFEIQSKNEIKVFKNCKCGNTLKYVEFYDAAINELSKKEKSKIIRIDNKTRNALIFDGALIIFFGFIWGLTPMFGISNYLISIPTILFGMIILFTSLNKSYHRKYLKPIYLITGLIALCALFMCILFTINVFNSMDATFFMDSDPTPLFAIPPASLVFGIALFSIFIMLWTFAGAKELI